MGQVSSLRYSSSPATRTIFLPLAVPSLAGTWSHSAAKPEELKAVHRVRRIAWYFMEKRRQRKKLLDLRKRSLQARIVGKKNWRQA
jgi:hypothetical protein